MDAVKRVHAANKDKVNIDHLRHAVVGAGKLLGKTRSWPTDLAIIDFLERFRYRDSIPRLIELLEFFASNPDKLKTGRQIRTRANEALTALTGAHHSMEKPEAWREFWEQEKGRLKVVERVAAAKSKPGTVSSEFFGIPRSAIRSKL